MQHLNDQELHGVKVKSVLRVLGNEIEDQT